MPIVFEEIHGEIATRRSQQREEREETAEKPAVTAAELVHHELRLLREREKRLCAE
jgi:hypothetical protein